MNVHLQENPGKAERHNYVMRKMHLRRSRGLAYRSLHEPGTASSVYEILLTITPGPVMMRMPANRDRLSGCMTDSPGTGFCQI